MHFLQAAVLVSKHGAVSSRLLSLRLMLNDSVP